MGPDYRVGAPLLFDETGLGEHFGPGPQWSVCLLRETTKSDLSDETRSPVSPTQVVE